MSPRGIRLCSTGLSPQLLIAPRGYDVDVKRYCRSAVHLFYFITSHPLKASHIKKRGQEKGGSSKTNLVFIYLEIKIHSPTAGTAEYAEI